MTGNDFLDGRSLLKSALGVALAAVVVAVPGCANRNAQTQNPEGYFTIIETGTGYEVYRHNDTGVYYLRSAGGGYTVMYNADGTPYTGESPVEAESSAETAETEIIIYSACDADTRFESPKVTLLSSVQQTGYATPYWLWDSPADVRTGKMYALHNAAEQLRQCGYTDDSAVIQAISAEWWKEKRDLDMIAATVWHMVGIDKIADADNDVQQNAMNHVAQLVVNRVKDSRFPNTVYDVLTYGLFPPDMITAVDGVPLECYYAAVTAMDGNTGISEDVVFYGNTPLTYNIAATFQYRSGEPLIFCR